MKDQYLTIGKTPAEGNYSELRSKFLATAYHVESAEQVRDIVAETRKNHHAARHVCYAYILGAQGDDYRSTDDGEPSGTAGKPILDQIRAHGLVDALVVVVRYYGGINLGTSRLRIAYREAAMQALDNCQTEERFVEEIFNFSYPYDKINSVMKVVKDQSPRILAHEINTTCKLTVAARKSVAEQLKTSLQKAIS